MIGQANSRYRVTGQLAVISMAVLIQLAPAPGQNTTPATQTPLKIDAATGVSHLLNKPELTYPKEALRQHIEG